MTDAAKPLTAEGPAPPSREGVFGRLRQGVDELFAGVAGGPGHEHRLRLAIEGALNNEWWRGYYCGIDTLTADLAQARQERDAERVRADGAAEALAEVREPQIERIIQDACELPDRTSPDDQPEMLLITGDELDMLLRRHLGLEDAALTPSRPTSPEVWTQAELDAADAEAARLHAAVQWQDCPTSPQENADGQ